MNKMHSLAKIILTGIGIFFGIRLIPQIITPISLVLVRHSDFSILTALAWVVVLGFCMAVLFYLFFFKSSELAQKIVGKDELDEPQSQIQWLPVAFRLVSVAAGLNLLIVFIWSTTDIISRYLLYSKTSYSSPGFKTFYTGPGLVNIEKIISSLVMLIIGIYLLCGAPHFVRWHVKKLLKQCTQEPEMKESQ